MSTHRQALHPFPARMASEIALERCRDIPPGSLVLDPMCGSGTTMRTAKERGLNVVGYDLDPLAVLMSKVATTPTDPAAIETAAQRLIDKAHRLKDSDTHLKWIDEDEETQKFILYWFAPPQISQLRKLAHLLQGHDEPVSNALKVGLSRIIVTKGKGCSLARDASHSRPHRVADTNDFDVNSGFLRSIQKLLSLLPVKGSDDTAATIKRGDARHLDLKDNSVDAIVTSPPYLNAIDYLRGHKLSLVWLGYRISELRQIRSSSVGVERLLFDSGSKPLLEGLLSNVGLFESLPRRETGIINRYAQDMYLVLKELSRVLKPKGIATFVVGNSCLRGTYISNTQIVTNAATMHKMLKVGEAERLLPPNQRYLPPPDRRNSSTLMNRMRTESVLTFSKL